MSVLISGVCESGLSDEAHLGRETYVITTAPLMQQACGGLSPSTVMRLSSGQAQPDILAFVRPSERSGANNTRLGAGQRKELEVCPYGMH